MEKKTLLMLVAVAVLTGAVTGCFHGFAPKKKAAMPAQESCEGLTGRVLEECRARKSSPSP